MEVVIGIDVGSVSVKLAAAPATGELCYFPELFERSKSFRLVARQKAHQLDLPIVVSEYHRTLGNPLQVVDNLLEGFATFVPRSSTKGIRVTGSGTRLVSEALGNPRSACTGDSFKTSQRKMASHTRQAVFQTAAEQNSPHG